MFKNFYPQASQAGIKYDLEVICNCKIIDIYTIPMFESSYKNPYRAKQWTGEISCTIKIALGRGRCDLKALRDTLRSIEEKHSINGLKLKIVNNVTAITSHSIK